MGEKNKAVYGRDRVVDYYGQLSRLQPAEAAILEQLKDRLGIMRMLDIGIGGGRTTQHFLPLVGEYIGIDYAPAMVAACRRRFAHSRRRPQLAVVDARDMGQFADNSFDFILFSFNGIDYVSHGDRLRILQEIHRVGKVGSYLLFSSHNLQSMARAFDYRQHLGRNPLKTYENLAMWAVTRWVNRPLSLAQVQSASNLVLRDESHNFRLQTYYIRPETQIEQLAFGFDTVETYPWTQRTQVNALGGGWLDSDLWLYYFCRLN